MTEKNKVKKLKISNPTVTEWDAQCPYCGESNYLAGGFINSCECNNVPIITSCDRCDKKFQVEVDTSKI